MTRPPSAPPAAHAALEAFVGSLARARAALAQVAAGRPGRWTVRQERAVRGTARRFERAAAELLDALMDAEADAWVRGHQAARRAEEGGPL
jgi:hypothetical protein